MCHVSDMSLFCIIINVSHRVSDASGVVRSPWRPLFWNICKGEFHVDCPKDFIGIDTCMYATHQWNMSVMCGEV